MESPAGMIGHQLCLQLLSQNLCFGSMVSQKMKNQMNTLHRFNMKCLDTEEDKTWTVVKAERLI